MAKQSGELPCVVAANQGGASCKQITFLEMERLTNRYANGLLEAGIVRGMRTLVMVKPGIEFIGLIFAMLKVGAVPVLIDPGMGVKRMLSCIRTLKPEGFIGVPLAQVVRVLKRFSFRSVKKVITVGRRGFWGGPTLTELEARSTDQFTAIEPAADEEAAILFTSGATGAAKGVVYEHGMFAAQVRSIQSCYGIEPGEVDLSCFPLFALFCPAMGMTSVIPDMDASRPALADPATLVSAIHEYNTTSSFGSPAVWKRVAAYCIEGHITLPNMKRVLIAGAPVSWQLINNVRRILPDGADVHTPYGATEGLPVASISGSEIKNETARLTRQGHGICVGKPRPEISLRIMRIDDQPVDHWTDELNTPRGTHGEIVVSGPVVTKTYAALPLATALAKIQENNLVWHRMGDIGYLDDEGRLWFCGRKTHRVITDSGTMFSICCEAIFNEHAAVARSALVGVGPEGRQRPIITVEPHPGRFPKGTRRTEIAAELLELGQANELTREIETVLFHRSFPVDVRHNAKIDRQKLALWAKKFSP